jgi:gamma-glutamyltranspeptidase / glutathione hydrolase
MKGFSAYPSRRSMIVSTGGAVATSHPLAAQAGLQMLAQGGTAADAVIAAAAVLNVVEPMSTGIGGDAFALVYDAQTKKVKALNGSGRAPKSLTRAEFAKRGLDEIPATGVLPINVPGAVAAWETLIQQHGKLDFATILAPAIHHARNGFAVSEIIARGWATLADKMRHHPDASRIFLPNGRAPSLGERFFQPELAATFEEIARGGAESFYRGDLAKRIVAALARDGAFLSLEDMASHTSDWVEPATANYRGYDVFECPPNGQGLTALIALRLLEGFDLASLPPHSPQSLHLQVEAMRLAFADAARYIADPAFVNVPVRELLSEEYIAKRRALIDPTKVGEVVAGEIPMSHDTVYVTAVDKYGNAVSFINSLYMGFGSGVVAGDTGICMQNRGANFVLEEGHPNVLEPGKRPYHTIIPCMVTKDGELWSSFGVMGGFMQPQGHVQMLVNMIDHGMNPQESLDAPRFELVEPYDGMRTVMFEHDATTQQSLVALGHDVAPAKVGGFGGGQIIVVEDGVAFAGSDPRKDGAAVGL